MFIFLHLYISFAAISLCEFKDFKGCADDVSCEWIYWNPSKCQNVCTQITEPADCELANVCYWDEECTYYKCNQVEEATNCNGVVACQWLDGKCWDQSCLTLQSKTSSTCPNSYCNWNNTRKLCYDKFCGDYVNQILCEQISFCNWKEYVCVLNTEIEQIQY